MKKLLNSIIASLNLKWYSDVHISLDLKAIKLKFICILFFIPGIGIQGKGAITIDSVSTTASSCANNGTALIYAHSSPNPFLLYAIVAGPIPTGLQNTATFNSLFPGSYTARIYDSNFDSLDTYFTITGNYQLPNLSPISTNPTCPGFNDGEILGNANPILGLQPFTWEIISPIIVPPQSSDQFSNLSSAAYQIRMTDACGNIQTRTAILTNGGTGLNYLGNVLVPYIQKIGCDTISVSSQFLINKEKSHIPITVNYNTVNGTITRFYQPIAVDTINYSPGIFMVLDTLYGLTYGDYLAVQITDVCNQSLFSTTNQIAPFDFELYFSNSIGNCNTLYSATANIKAYPYFPFHQTFPKAPLSFTLTNESTNALVDSATNQYWQIYIHPQPENTLYHLEITDGCGDTFQQDFMWPGTAATSVSIGAGPGCLDSTATIYFYLQGFKSAVTVTINSGPSSVHSTKLHYAFNDTIIYPQIYTGRNANGMCVKNLPAGIYECTVSDSCGNSITSTFEILEIYLSNLDYKFYVRSGCQGSNVLYFNAYSPTPMAVACYIRDAATGIQLKFTNSISGLDSLVSLPIGQYTIEIYYGYYYGGGQYYDTTITAGNQNCWAVFDTITLPPYNNNIFKSNVTVTCNGITYVALSVDSSRGVPPYQYEIISGPQVFPIQDSSFFQLSAIGNYVIRIQDACGNSTIQQITVDSASFPPIVKTGSTCASSRIVLSGISSAYFAYEWILPNGNTYIGDSLVIDPFSIVDTGMYQIIKYVSINGCSDTLYSYYHLTIGESIQQIFSICSGDSINVSGNFYSLPGVYTDSLTSSAGCDSILIITLDILPQNFDTLQLSICSGDSLQIGNNFYSLAGFYRDSTQNNSGCFDIHISELQITGFPDSVQYSICPGDTILIGNHKYYNSGIYRDTLTSVMGCDSIIILSLTISPFKTDSIVANICQGENYLFGGLPITQSGIYTDTLTTTGCDSIIILSLTVSPFKTDSIVANICQGENYFFGGLIITQSGIYTDTLNTTGCDSIIVLDLRVGTEKRDSITRTICFGESYVFGGTLLTQTGFYSDTLNTSSCDSIIILNLKINPEIKDTLHKFICLGETFNFGGTILNSAGFYSDTIPTNNCDSISILELQTGTYKTDTIQQNICQNENYFFAGNILNTSGFYSDTLTTSTCDSIVVLELTLDSLPSIQVISNLTQIVPGTVIQLNTITNQTLIYNWNSVAVISNTGIPDPQATLFLSSWIFLEVSDMNGCKAKDSIFITVDELPGKCDTTTLYIPNTFTPNNDGINDQFQIEGLNIQIIDLFIYNRWGQEIFESHGNESGWDGNYEGEMKSDIYVYELNYIICNNNIIKKLKGKIALLN